MSRISEAKLTAEKWTDGLVARAWYPDALRMSLFQINALRRGPKP